MNKVFCSEAAAWKKEECHLYLVTMYIEHMQLSGIFPFYGCVPLGWSGLGSMIQDLVEHGTCTCTSNMYLLLIQILLFGCKLIGETGTVWTERIEGYY